jgi:phosphoglycolate phosphatase
MNNMTTANLIFDFDGTLVDSGPGILHTLALVLQAQGLQPQLPLTRDLIGPPLPVTLRKLAGDVEPAVLEALVADFRAIYDGEGVMVTKPYPGIVDVIAALAARGCGLHLATNKREKPTLLLLDHLGLTPHFKSVYCLDSRNPGFANKGAMLQIQLVEQALVAADCLYIGDTNHDEQAAAAAGLPFVAVAWGYGVDAQQVSAVARQINTPTQLLTL